MVTSPRPTAWFAADEPANVGELRLLIILIPSAVPRSMTILCCIQVEASLWADFDPRGHELEADRALL